MLRIIFSILVFVISATAVSAFEYDIRRLPNALGKQFLDVNGNKRLIMPTFVSNEGIVGGMRLTWSFDEQQSGGATALVNQSGYLYDLNTRTFIAQNIGGFPVTQVTETDYISKRLHPNGQRWQTWRCPINGLVPRASNPVVSDNPSCVLLDNDYLDQTPDGENSVAVDKDAYWASWFIGVNVLYTHLMVVQNNTMAVNNLGTAAVYDLADNVAGTPDTSQDIGARYYYDNGNVETASAMYAKAADAIGDPSLFSSSNYGGMLLGEVNGKNAAWFFETVEPVENGDGSYTAEVDQPITVYQVIFENDGSASATSIVISHTNQETGYYVRPVAVSKNGLILTDRGLCTFSSGCTDLNYLSDFDLADMETYIPGELLLESGDILYPDDDHGFTLFDLNGSSPEPFYFVEEAQNKFGEALKETTDFEYPYGPGFSRYLGKNIRWSETGDYGFVFSQLDNGTPRIYSFKRQ